MTKEQIDKAFEGRWRMKHYILENINGTYAKEIARDFFETGILIAEKNSVPEASVSDLPPTDANFEVWWNLYDKKRGKEKCIKKWEKLSQKDKQACLAATPAYVASTPDVTYRKDPYTYLNNKSWQDEVYFRNNPDIQRQQRVAAVAERIAAYTEND